VTAGVLRGERSRFQLFGDTMNTASRMESTGLRNRIQVSQETADYLVAAGKAHWITPRAEMVVAKGKGELKTYWVSIGRRATGLPRENEDSGRTADAELLPESLTQTRAARLVQWHVDLLMERIGEIVKCRASRRPITEAICSPVTRTGCALDELQDFIRLPTSYTKSYDSPVEDPIKLEVPPVVESQLVGFISSIASMYAGK
jgi:Adenylate and Guanylate cyclase catalytic domain